MTNQMTTRDVESTPIVSPAVREEICRRTAHIDSDRAVASTIFSTIRDAGLELECVTLDEMKDLVVQAVSSFRRSRRKQDVAAA